MLVIFTLSMLNNNSWDGKWSGENRLYYIIKDLVKPPKLGVYSYNFGDGWRAAITVREVTSTAADSLRKQSEGFCGYEWMVDSIIKDGDIYGPMRPLLTDLKISQSDGEG